MGALAPLLIPLIPGLLRGVESIFKGKPKSGPDKMLAIIRALGQIVESMLIAKAPLSDGTLIPEKSVTDDWLRGLVESEFQKWKGSGEGTPAPTGNYFFVQGTITPLNVK